MKLTLKNFRCHKDAVFTLPETGLILLSGVSGSGKSTLIKAVFYALYGKIKKPCSFGCSSCSVELEYRSVTVYRSTKPNILKVTAGKDLYEDDAAQSYIDSFIGLTKDEFEISGYIAQKNSVCILSLPPLEQLQTIQTLSFHQDEITGLKEKLKGLIKDSNDELTKIKTQLTFSKDELSQLPSIKDLKIEITDEELATHKKILDELPEKIKQLIEQKTDLVTSITEAKNMDRELLALLLNKKELEAEQISKKKIRDEILQRIKPRENNSLEKKIEYLETKSSYELALKQHLEEVSARRDFLKENIWSEKILNANIKKLEYQKTVKRVGAYNDLTKKLSELMKRKEILEQCEILVCPSCDGSLRLKDGVLIVSEVKKVICEKPTDSREQLESSIAKVKNGIEELERFGDQDNSYSYDENLESDIMENKQLSNDLKTLGSSFPKQLTALEKKLETLPKTDESIVKLKKEFERFKNAEIVYKQNISELKRVDSDIMNIVAKLDSCNSKIKKITKIDIPPLEKRLKVVLEELSELERSYKEQFSKKELYQEYEKNNELIASFSKWTKRIERYSHDYKEAEAKHVGLLRIKERYRQAEILAIESTVASINQHTQYYLDHFFPDDPLHARLETNDELQIKTIINYKGYEYDSISQLSGGEFDRCVLASICGVGTMMNCPIMFLDESLASLDSHNNTEILGFLKELSGDKLIAVCSHEAIEGVFSEIVAL